MSKLTSFEKDLFKAVKFDNPDLKIKADNLMEWSNSKEKVQSGLLEGEKMFNALGLYVAFKVDV